MKTKTLKAAIITKDENNVMLSIKGADNDLISVYWPTRVTQDLNPGDEFYITLSEEKPEENQKPAVEDLRALLFELIN